MGRYEKTIYFMLLLLIYLCVVPFVMIFLIQIINIDFGGETSRTAVILFITPFVCSLLPGIFYFAVTRENIKRTLCVKKIGLKNFLLVVLMAFLIQPAASFIAMLTSLLFPNDVSAVMTSLSNIPFWEFIFISAFLPAVFEELMFRGIILSGCKSAGIAQSAVISGLFFGIMHLDPQQFTYAFLIGIFFAFLVIYSGSIFSTITAHFIINASQGALVFLSNMLMEKYPELANQAETADVTAEQILLFGGMAVISGTLLTLVFSYFLKINKGNIHKPEGKPPEKLITVPFIAIIVIFILYLTGMEVLQRLIIG